MDTYAETAVSPDIDGYAGTKTAAWAVFALTFLLMLFLHFLPRADPG